MPCRAPVLGEPRFVPSCASSASPPGPGREGAPGQPTALTLSWPSPPPWQPRSRPDMQPVAPGQPSLRRASAQPGSSPDRDGEIPAPRSLLPCPAELGWGLCLLGRELCALRGVHWGWGLRALGSVCLGWGLCVLQGGVCWDWGLGAGSHVPWGRGCAEWGLFIGGVGSRAGLHLCVREGQDPLCVSVCWSVDGAGEPQLCLPDGPAAGERHSRCRHLCFEPCLSSVSSLAQSQWQLGPSIPLRGFPQHPASP